MWQVRPRLVTSLRDEIVTCKTW